MDTKLAFEYFSDIERIALVGEKAWEQGMAIFCKPFTAAKVRYFDHDDRSEALEWVTG